MNIASLVLDQAREQPDAPAIHYPTGHQAGRVRYSHATNGELDRESDWIAHGLESVGIGLGVRTALMVRPSLQFFALTLALFKAGAVPVVVDPGIGLRRLRRCFDEAEPEAFIGIPQAQAARRVFGWGRATIRSSITVGRRWFWGGPTLNALSEVGRQQGAYDVVSTSDEDIAAILFTSGSTGPPKGVVYRHGNFAAQVEALRALAEIRPGEVDLPTFPLFALFDPALGMTAVVPDMDPTRPGDVDPRRIIEAADEFGATNLFGSPALLDRVGRYGETHGTKISSLRRVVSAGAPVPASVQERFLAMLPDDSEIFTPYGATECLPVSCISSRHVLSETAARTEAGAGICVGAPVPSVEVRLVAVRDEAIPRWQPELECRRGEIGEITVRGPQATTGYYNRPEADAVSKVAAAADEDESGGFWHRMGDVGYFDDAGLLWYCGRKADRVETPVGTLYTAPCEGIFDAHRRVRRTALVGVPLVATAEGEGGVLADKGIEAGRFREPVICVELLAGTARGARAAIAAELRELGAQHEATAGITTFLFHRGFPVDIRHNAKIGRPELARWAARRLRRAQTK